MYRFRHRDQRSSHPITFPHARPLQSLRSQSALESVLVSTTDDLHGCRCRDQLPSCPSRPPRTPSSRPAVVTEMGTGGKKRVFSRRRRGLPLQVGALARITLMRVTGGSPRPLLLMSTRGGSAGDASGRFLDSRVGKNPPL